MGEGRAGRAGSLRLAWRHGLRASRGGEWWILLAALVIAIAAITAVTQMSDRVRAAMTRQGAVTLAADLRLDLRAPLDTTRRATLDNIGVRHAAITIFPSVIAAHDRVTLVSVKAVADAYPLRGQLILRRGPPGTPTRKRDHGPSPGTAWVEQRVLDEQDLDIGDTIQLGDARLRIAAALVSEPDRSPGFASIAPRVMIAAADIATTGLLGPGSRAHYAELIAGPAERVAAVRTRLAPTLRAGERLQTPTQANRALSRALERADVFLDLAALVAVVLAGVAIALSAQQHAETRLDEIALLKTLGAPRGLIGRMLAWQLVIAGAAGVVGGLIVGSTSQYLIGQIIARAFTIALPAPPMSALWPGPVIGVVLLAGFAWPAFTRARRVAPVRVLARALDDGRPRVWAGAGVAVFCVVALAGAATGDAVLTAWIVTGATVGIVLLATSALGLLWLVERVRQHMGRRLAPGVRLGLAALSRRRAASVLQIVAFGVGLIMLFTLVIVRGDLLAGWQADIAADAPNRFLINITPDQQSQVADFLSTHGIRARFHPVVRARLTAVNGQPLTDDTERSKSAGELTRRDLNLSWSDTLKRDNRIVAGRWWQPGDIGKALISIDESVAKRLDAGIGDQLRFDIAGETVNARILSIRAIDWSSLQANFYVLFAPGVLTQYPATYITSFHLPAARHAVLANLVRRFSNISVIDIDAILAQLTTLISRVSLAVELVFGFTLAAGLVVLLAALQASRSERRREAALLRALGARSRWLRQATLVECLLLGGCASVLAAVVAQIGAIILAVQVFDLDYAWRPGVWLAAIVIATLVIALAGVFSLRDLLRQPAWASLRAND